MNAFFEFSQSYRQNEKSLNRIIQEEIGLKWRSMNVRDREPYVNSSIRKKEQFKRENPNFKEKRIRSVRRRKFKFVNNSPETMQQEQFFKKYMNKSPEKMQEK
ncbi:7677_t:CDS:1 [Acaulospora morrowiae]|uniref:7677_t:CDS:1 n=1 Tax=Acaulospora morrowiae TaxID=94023 RepID=A0A9N9FFY8_9GLOM|nr:7677_t:CDS:1 [Acaulospora morrowiae]